MRDRNRLQTPKRVGAAMLWIVALAAQVAAQDEKPKPTAKPTAKPEPKIETVAGNGQWQLGAFSGPTSAVNMGQVFGVEIGPGGALYVTEVENHRVFRVDLRKAQVTTVAGDGKPSAGPGTDGIAAASASMNEPYEVRFDRAGNMYVVEMRGAVVRRVDAKTGLIQTIAGNGVQGFGGDGGPATSAQLKQPHSIALSGDKLYIADLGNHRIRKVDLRSGVIDTLVGNGNAEMPRPGTRAAADVPIRGPRALYVQDQTLWIALREGNSVWTLDLKSKRMERVAGTGETGYSGDGGPALAATFNGPKGIVVDRNKRNVFVVDTENQAIRRIDLRTGRVSSVAGVGPEGRGYGGDGGAATSAKLDRPHGIAIDRAGTIYIGDTNNHRVRRFKP